MATIVTNIAERRHANDVLSGTPRAHPLDRWIFVFMAAWFIAIVLAGFIPDSLMKVALVRAGERPPFPPVLHVHAILMGAFLLVLLAQSTLMAMGRRALHMQIGLAGMLLAVSLVVVGAILAPTMYHQLWGAAHSGLPGAQEKFGPGLVIWENILLVQIRIGMLFALFMAIAFKARGVEAGMHKRMIFLATAMALPAGIDRIPWLSHTMPASPLSIDLYTVAAVSPMLAWDVIRNRSLHRAWWIWFGITIPCAILVNLLWDTPWWHRTAQAILGV